MLLDYEVFEQALTLFHHYSRQNSETVRQMQAKGILPTTRRRGFAVLDIGAGQGHLPSLMQPYADTLVLLEPNRRCVEVLQQAFPHVYPCPWGASALERLHRDYPQGFDLITMSHMLYHFDGLDDIRDKVRMALTLLKPGGQLVIVLNQPSAPMALIGIAFQVATGRQAEVATNQDLHAFCHTSRFYRDLAGQGTAVVIASIDTPLDRVPSRAALIALLRMCLINPLSESPCATDELDAFISEFLDSHYPRLTYPATLPSRDELIVIRLTPAPKGRILAPIRLLYGLFPG